MSSANKQSPLDFRLSCIIAPSYRYLRRRASHLKDQLRQNCIFPTLHLRLDGQFWLLRPSCWQDPSLERHNSASGPRSRRTWDLELYTPVSQQRVQVTPAEAQIHPPTPPPPTTLPPSTEPSGARSHDQRILTNTQGTITCEAYHLHPFTKPQTMSCLIS